MELHFNNRFLFLLVLLPAFMFSQNDLEEMAERGDPRYREDQFYLGITYNALMDTPSGINSRGLTGGIHGGVLRDMPINERRNLAIAVGLGLAYDRLGNNLFIGEDLSDNSIFRILDRNVDFTDNKFELAMVEIPIEFRWRTSTPTDYKFWRVYTGVRFGYSYWYQSNFKQPGNDVRQSKIPEFVPLRMTATLSFGYGTFNFFAAYSINPFFKDAYLANGEEVNIRTLKIGLIFYVL